MNEAIAGISMQTKWAEMSPLPEQVRNRDKLPDNAISFVPDCMEELVDIGLQTTQAHPDNLILGLLSFIVPLAGGARICLSSADKTGETVRPYFLIIGPSGVGKTVIVTRFVPPLLYDLENEIADENEIQKTRKQEFETELKSLGRSKEEQPRRVNLESKLADIQLSHKTYLVESATSEGLARAFEHGSSPLTILDEFGALLKRAERSDHTRGFVDMLTQIADRGSTKARITKGDDPPALLKNLSLSILATTTPEDLQKETALSLLRGGHLARYIISYVTEARSLPDRDYLTIAEMETFKRWGVAIGAAAQTHGGRFELSSDAETYLREYRKTISENFVETVNSGGPDGGTIIRLIRQAKAFSLLLHLAGNETREKEQISKKTMQQACGLVNYYHERHHHRLMDYLRHGEEQARRINISERILKYLRQHDGRQSLRQVYRYLHLKKNTTVEVLKYLEAQNMVRFDDDDDDNDIVCL